MKKLASPSQFALALSFVIAVGCGSDNSEPEVVSSGAPPRPPESVEPAAPQAPTGTRPKKAGPVKLPALPVAVDLPAVTERSALLQRLPKSALFVLRFPHVEKLGEAFARTPFAGLAAQRAASGSQGGYEELVAKVQSELHASIPEFDAFRERLSGVQGEAVFAVTSIDAAAFVSHQGSALPFTCALMLDAGARAGDVDEFVKAALSGIERRSRGVSVTPPRVETVATGGDGWRTRVTALDIEADLMREGTQFLLHLAPAGSLAAGDHPLAVHEIELSFLAADIMRGTKDLSREGTVAVEFVLNLEPVWGALDLLAPAELKAVVTGMGASSIRGVSAVTALGERGIHEEMFLMSPGGKDLLTRAVTSRPLEPELSRFVSDYAKAATIATFDLRALFHSIEGLLPDDGRRALANALLDAKKAGFDLRAGVIDNVGPTFAVVGDLDMARLWAGDGASGALDFTLIAGVQDGTRLRETIEAFVARSGLQDSVFIKDIHGFKVCGSLPTSIPRPDGNGAIDLDPHWYVGDDVLVFSLSRAGLARALASSWNEQNRGPKVMAAALAREKSAFSVGVQERQDGGDPFVTIGRRTSLGLEYSTRDGAGMTTAWTFAAGAAILSAVAIPSYLGARTDAEESVATDTLRQIAAAQDAFKGAAELDQDGDGEGEYGTLAELTGASALRDGKAALSSPLLPPDLAPDADGLVRRGTFLFRLDLSTRLTRRTDYDEREFQAYAWPARADGSARRAFAIDASGRVFATDNTASLQRYAGVERMPKPDAMRRTKSGAPRGHTAPAPSQDGGIWHEQ